jgi:spore germination cell wall hydrolase CwlJ-like protein
LRVEPLAPEAQIMLPQVVESPPVLLAPPLKAVSLAAMVTQQPQPSELSRELHCLAGATYFESKSESLAGQLAVARVIVARSKSGRFPNSYCGVVYQPSQFSFVRGGGMPAIARASRQWKNAVAIAQIAHSNAWASPVEGALYFHAAYVSPGWHLRRVGRIDNHVFYR